MPDDSYYTGITNNLEQRLQQHQFGMNIKSYTYNRRPVELVYHEVFTNPTQAITFEKQVKGWSREKKETLIKDNWDALKKLSECKNETSHKNYHKP